VRVYMCTKVCVCVYMNSMVCVRVYIDTQCKSRYVYTCIRMYACVCDLSRFVCVYICIVCVCVCV